MLDKYFTEPKALRRFRSGPTGPYADEYAAALHRAGFAHASVCRASEMVRLLGDWIESRGISVAGLDADAVAAFGEDLVRRRRARTRRRMGPPNREGIAAAHRFLDHLRDAGIVAAAETDGDAAVRSPLLAEFERWMRRHRGVTEATLADYRRPLVELLKMEGDDPGRYTAGGLRRFVLRRCEQRGSDEARRVATGLRMFLRYLAAHGLCDAALLHAVPGIACWKLSSLPRYLPADQIERVIASCDVATPAGLRDRAIVLLLVRLALRAGDIVRMRLGDVDWQAATVLVHGKGRRDTLLPLPQDVGDAVRAYVQTVRPPVDDDHVFIRMFAPLRAWPDHRGVTDVVKRAFLRAGVTSPRGKAHVLRHSAATEMLRQGVSLAGIGAVLRHRSVRTTALYAKVDFAALGPIAQAWPGEVPSC